MFVKKNQDTALKVEHDGDFRICCCLNCCKRWYFTFNGTECSKLITVEAIDVLATNQQTPIYTSTVRSGGTVRGLVKVPCAWDWWLEIAHFSRAVLTRIPGTTQWLESLSRKFLRHSS